ncbi:hypothetical protein CCH79_00010217 [Gambusia affinis]|uniref:Unique cartilage matrix-associated protein n=1 Tax=Gambusia affinis TaxID=33528 RepID=A0A315VMN1_GAMAF|nr:hypothetical protein CCH79_00010217 [Gambusia affinis]
MSWTYATLLALLAALLALSLSPEAAESAAVDSSTRNAKSPAGVELHFTTVCDLLFCPSMLKKNKNKKTIYSPILGQLRRIFMKEADASNFFRKRSRRAVKSQDEISGELVDSVRSERLRRVAASEQRQVLAADERKREFHEEKRNEFESYAEEDNDEQDERTRESTEQWREFHYDGMNPSHEYNRQTA